MRRGHRFQGAHRAGHGRAYSQPERIEKTHRLRPAVADRDHLLVTQEDLWQLRQRGKDGVHNSGDRDQDQDVQHIADSGARGDSRSMKVQTLARYYKGGVVKVTLRN